ncbi:MAG: YtxH domain-containing protein [Cryomorphaceae bacterium]|nr:YtxH domain-containing protein [Cryomorphaceae bacterium]
MEQSNQAGKIILSIVVGAAIGGTLGILYAPYKGKKTRNKLAAKGGDLKNLIQDHFVEVVDKINNNHQLEVEKKIK